MRRRWAITLVAAFLARAEHDPSRPLDSGDALALWREFASLDSDGDGRLSPNELLAAAAVARGGGAVGAGLARARAAGRALTEEASSEDESSAGSSSGDGADAAAEDEEHAEHEDCEEEHEDEECHDGITSVHCLSDHIWTVVAIQTTIIVLSICFEEFHHRLVHHLVHHKKIHIKARERAGEGGGREAPIKRR